MSEREKLTNYLDGSKPTRLDDHLWTGPKIVTAQGVYFYCECHKQDCKFRELRPEEALKLYEIVSRFNK